MPHLDEFVETFDSEDLVVMMISKEEAGLLNDFVEEHASDIWIVRDADGDMFEDYDVRAYPTTLLIGKDGKIAYRGHPMRVEAEDIQELIDAE